MINTDKQLQEIYDKYMAFTDELVGEYGSILEIAAVMMTQALSIYRSTMSEEDYDRMVDTISSSRSDVKTFERPKLQ